MRVGRHPVRISPAFRASNRRPSFVQADSPTSSLRVHPSIESNHARCRKKSAPTAFRGSTRGGSPVQQLSLRSSRSFNIHVSYEPFLDGKCTGEISLRQNRVRGGGCTAEAMVEVRRQKAEFSRCLYPATCTTGLTRSHCLARYVALAMHVQEASKKQEPELQLQVEPQETPTRTHPNRQGQLPAGRKWLGKGNERTHDDIERRRTTKNHPPTCKTTPPALSPLSS